MAEVSARAGGTVWCKRDDLTSPVYGGNKVRKLEFLIAEAQHSNADCIVTTGAVGSHHVYATTVHGRAHGLETYAVLAPQPHTAHAENQLRADLAQGARLRPATSYAQVARKLTALTLRLRLEGRRPYLIPPGGSSAVGTLGHVSAGLELTAQIDAGACPDPAAIYVACGTGATAAGLALGLALGGVTAELVAVRVTDAVFARRARLRRLIHKADQLLRAREPSLPDVKARALSMLRLDTVEFAPGYGHPTPASQAALQLAMRDGLKLDSTYTGKALACLLRENSRADVGAGKPLIYWHTLNSADMGEVLANAPSPPEALQGLLTQPAH